MQKITGLDPWQAQKKRDDWADICRMHHHPVKVCRQCNQSKPNTRENFAIKATGRVGFVCAGCQSKKLAKKEWEAGAGAIRGDCVMCDCFEKLIMDRQAPSPQRLCRACLNVVNIISRQPKVRPKLFLARVGQYLDWRNQSAR